MQNQSEFIYFIDTANISGYQVSPNDFTDNLYGFITLKSDDIMKVLFDEIDNHVMRVFSVMFSRLKDCFEGNVSRDRSIYHLYYSIRTDKWQISVIDVYALENDNEVLDLFRKEYEDEIEMPVSLDNLVKMGNKRRIRCYGYE